MIDAHLCRRAPSRSKSKSPGRLNLTDRSFTQSCAVTSPLLVHCQISTGLLRIKHWKAISHLHRRRGRTCIHLWKHLAPVAFQPQNVRTDGLIKHHDGRPIRSEPGWNACVSIGGFGIYRRRLDLSGFCVPNFWRTAMHTEAQHGGKRRRRRVTNEVDIRAAHSPVNKVKLVTLGSIRTEVRRYSNQFQAMECRTIADDLACADRAGAGAI